MLYAGANGCGGSNLQGSSGRFNYPSHIVGDQDSYGINDVGITHPNHGSFIRINGQGEIIIHTNGVDIHMSTTHRRITIHASDVKILAKSIFWNKAAFDPNSFSFSHPLLQPIDFTNRAILQSNVKQVPNTLSGES